MEAYYADSLVEVYDFCQQYDVDYMVVNRETFQEGEQYALLEVPGELKIYENEDHFVMPCWPPASETDIPPELAQMEEANLVWRAIEPAVVQQGASADLHLYWENLDPGADTPQLCLSLISERGEATDPTCMPLSSAEDIRQLGDDTFAFMTYELEVSPYLNSGTYQVLAEVFSSDDSSGKPVTGVVGEIDFKAEQRQFASQEEQEAGQSIASWDDQIALTNADVVNLDNHSLEIDLRWQALARMNDSNKVFVHLVGTNGSGLVAQVDAVPRNWTYPTNWWEKGEIVTDTLSIPLDGIRPGSYQLWLGLYDEASLERLPLDGSAASSDPTYQNAIKLADLEL